MYLALMTWGPVQIPFMCFSQFFMMPPKGLNHNLDLSVVLGSGYPDWDFNGLLVLAGKCRD
jgi:hypothetical protein